MLLHVITNFTAHAGAESMLARLLRQSGEHLVVPLMDVSDHYRSLEGDRVRIEPLQARSVAGMAASARPLAAILRRERPDAVLCWMYHAMVVGTLAAGLARTATPIFWNVRQSLDDMAVLSRSTRIALHGARLLSHTPDGIVFNSGRAADMHRRFGFRNANMTVIPNGFEPPAEAPAHRPGDALTFGIAARLHPQKDHETFFQAAALVHARYPAVRFQAAGAGLEAGSEAVERLLQASGLPRDAIALRGEISDMAGFYGGIDVLVLSSRTEGFPNVVGEAMSHGRPVVTTDVGDAAAIVGETGFVVPPRDVQAMADAMERLILASAADFRARGLAARARIDAHYSLPAIARQFDRFVGTG